MSMEDNRARLMALQAREEYLIALDRAKLDDVVVHMRLNIIHQDAPIFKDAPIFTEKPWLRFRTHPTNPRGRK